MKIVFSDLFQIQVMTTLDLQNTLQKIIKGHEQVVNLPFVIARLCTHGLQDNIISNGGNMHHWSGKD